MQLYQLWHNQYVTLYPSTKPNRLLQFHTMKAQTTTTKAYQTTQDFADKLAYNSLEERMPTYVYKNYIDYLSYIRQSSNF